MSEKKNTANKDDISSDWLNDHNINEIVETTHLEILDKYDLIPRGNLEIIRRVRIDTLPITKMVDTDKYKGKMTTMNITDSGKQYSLTVNAISTQRSILAIAIKMTEKNLNRKIKDKNEIDLSSILGKMFTLSRRRFEAKGFVQDALVFDLISK